MFDFLKQIVYKVVEVEKPRPSIKMGPQEIESVLSLQHHPGFLFLLDKLRYQRAALVTTLVNERQESMTDSEFLKSGIAWTGWLENQLATATKLKTRQPETQAEPEVADAFRELQRQLEVVGQ